MFYTGVLYYMTYYMQLMRVVADVLRGSGRCVTRFAEIPRRDITRFRRK